MTEPRSSVSLVLLVLAVTLLVAAGSAWAGPDPAGGTGHHSHPPAFVVAHAGFDSGTLAIRSAPDAPGMPWSALLACMMAAVFAWCRPRRALVLALILLLAIFAYESGLHSVHHGFDPARAETCASAAASTNVAAVASDASPTAEVLFPLLPGSLDPANAAPLVRFLCPDQGRAPPAPSA